MVNKIKELSGHSGCSVILVEDKEKIYVSKFSPSILYNFRLKKQCKKQMMFNSSHSVTTPKIFNVRYNKDGCWGFDMEFVRAKTLAEFLPEISIAQIPSLIDCLFDSLYLNNKEKDPKANKIFNRKINELVTKLSGFQNLEPAFKTLKNYNWENILKSPCHGDLTLENILISYDRKIYLIDFLDSFYNSWMIDIAKLLQDLELKWSFRNTEISSNVDLRLLVAKENLVERILQTENGKQHLDSIYHVLLLNVLRIYPYTKDSKTLYFLDKCIEKVLQRISEINKIKELA